MTEDRETAQSNKVELFKLNDFLKFTVLCLFEKTGVIMTDEIYHGASAKCTAVLHCVVV